MNKNISMIFLVLFSVLAVIFFLYPVIPNAQADCPAGTSPLDPLATSSLCIPDSEETGLLGGLDDPDDTDVYYIIEIVLDWILSIAGILAMLIIVAGGLRYMASAGEDDKTKEAKSMIMNGIIGLVVVLVAYAIVVTISNVLAY